MKHYEEEGLYIIKDDNDVAMGEITYVVSGDNLLIIDHTLVHDEFRGMGIASKLVAHIVELAREQNKKIMPLCPFAKGEFDRKTEYHDVLY